MLETPSKSFILEPIRNLQRLRTESLKRSTSQGLAIKLDLKKPLGDLPSGTYNGALKIGTYTNGLSAADIHTAVLRINTSSGPQDFHFDTCAGTSKSLRHILWPRKGPLSGPYSSIARYKIRKQKVTLLLVPEHKQNVPLADLAKLVALQQVSWALHTPEKIGVLRAVEVRGNGEWLKFDRDHTGAGAALPIKQQEVAAL